MSELFFRVRADYEEAIKCREELEKVRSEIAALSADSSPVEVEKLTKSYMDLISKWEQSLANIGRTNAFMKEAMSSVVDIIKESAEVTKNLDKASASSTDIAKQRLQTEARINDYLKQQHKEAVATREELEKSRNASQKNISDLDIKYKGADITTYSKDDVELLTKSREQLKNTETQWQNINTQVEVYEHMLETSAKTTSELAKKLNIDVNVDDIGGSIASNLESSVGVFRDTLLKTLTDLKVQFDSTLGSLNEKYEKLQNVKITSKNKDSVEAATTQILATMQTTKAVSDSVGGMIDTVKQMGAATAEIRQKEGATLNDVSRFVEILVSDIRNIVTAACLKIEYSIGESTKAISDSVGSTSDDVRKKSEDKDKPKSDDMKLVVTNNENPEPPKNRKPYKTPETTSESIETFGYKKGAEEAQKDVQEALQRILELKEKFYNKNTTLDEKNSIYKEIEEETKKLTELSEKYYAVLRSVRDKNDKLPSTQYESDSGKQMPALSADKLIDGWQASAKATIYGAGANKGEDLLKSMKAYLTSLDEQKQKESDVADQQKQDNQDIIEQKKEATNATKEQTKASIELFEQERERNKQLKEEYKQLELNKSSLENVNEKDSERFAELSKQKENGTLSDDMTHEYENLKSLLESDKVRLEQYAKQKEELEKSIAESNSRMKSIHASLTKSEQEQLYNKGLRKAIDERQKEIEKLEAENKKLVAENWATASQGKKGYIGYIYRKNFFRNLEDGSIEEDVKKQYYANASKINSNESEIERIRNEVAKQEKALEASDARLKEMADDTKKVADGHKEGTKAVENTEKAVKKVSAAQKMLKSNDLTEEYKHLTEQLDEVRKKVVDTSSEFKQYDFKASHIEELLKDQNLTPEKRSELESKKSEAETKRDSAKAALDAYSEEYDEITDKQKELGRQIEQENALRSNLNTQLNIARKHLAQMVDDGKQGTEEYQKQLEIVAELTKKRQKQQWEIEYTGDMGSFKALVDAGRGVAGAFATAQGVLGLFNEKSEEMAAIQTKIQSLIAITIGLQETYTFVTKAATIATSLFNKVMKMSPMGKFVLVASAVVTAVTAISSVFKRQSEQVQKTTADLNKYNEVSIETNKKIRDSVANTMASNVSAYEKLKKKYNELGDNLKAKEKFVRDNKEAMRELGFAVDGVSDAEAFFVGRTGDVIRSLEMRARAAALLDVQKNALKEYYKDLFEAEEKAENYEIYEVGQSSKDISEAKQRALIKNAYKRSPLEGDNVSSAIDEGRYKLTARDAEFLNERSRISAEERSKEEIERIEDEYKDKKAVIERMQKDLEKGIDKIGEKTKGGVLHQILGDGKDTDKATMSIKQLVDHTNKLADAAKAVNKEKVKPEVDSSSIQESKSWVDRLSDTLSLLDGEHISISIGIDADDIFNFEGGAKGLLSKFGWGKPKSPTEQFRKDMEKKLEKAKKNGEEAKFIQETDEALGSVDTEKWQKPILEEFKKEASKSQAKIKTSEEIGKLLNTAKDKYDFDIVSKNISDAMRFVTVGSKEYNKLVALQNRLNAKQDPKIGADINAQKVAAANEYYDRMQEIILRGERALRDAEIAAIEDNGERERAEREEQYKRDLADLKKQRDDILKEIYNKRKREYELTSNGGKFENTAAGRGGWRSLIGDTLENTQEAEKEILKELGKGAIMDEIQKQFGKGNVDVLARPLIDAAKLAEKGWKDAGEGIATVFSSQYGITDKEGQTHEILVTPILANGKVLSEKELEDYLHDTLEGAEDILKADKLGIVIDVDVDKNTDNIKTLTIDAKNEDAIKKLREVKELEGLIPDNVDTHLTLTGRIEDIEKWQGAVDGLRESGDIEIKVKAGNMGDYLHILHEQLYNLPDDAVKRIQEMYNNVDFSKFTKEEKHLFDESYKAISASIKKRKSEEERYLRERLKAEETALNEYLKKYGNAQEQRLAIEREYDEKIRNAQTEGERLTYVVEKDQALKKFDNDKEMDAMNMEEVFNDLEFMNTEKLKRLKEQLRDMMSDNTLDIEQYKTLAEQIEHIDEAILEKEAKQNTLLGLRVRSMSDIKRLKMELEEDKTQQNNAKEDVTKAQDGLATARSGVQVALGQAGVNTDKEITTANSAAILEQVAKTKGKDGKELGKDSEQYKKVEKAFDDLAKSETNLKNANEKKKNADDRVNTTQEKLSEAFKDVRQRVLDFANSMQEVVANINSLPDLLGNLGLDDASATAQSVADAANAGMGAMSDFASGNYIGAASKAIDMAKSVTDALGMGDNTAEMQEAIEKLTLQSKALEQAMKSLENAFEDAKAGNAMAIADDMKELQKNLEKNERESMEKEARKHGTWRSSLNTSVNDNSGWQKAMGQVSKILGQSVKTSQDFLSLSADQMQKIIDSDNGATWAKILEEYRKEGGTGGRSDQLPDMLQNYVDKFSGALDDIDDMLAEKLILTTKENIFDELLNSLYDLADGSKDAFNNIERNWQSMINKMVLYNTIGDSMQEEVNDWYKELTNLQKKRNGGISEEEKKQLEEYENELKEMQNWGRNATGKKYFDKKGNVYTKEEYNKKISEITKKIEDLKENAASNGLSDSEYRSGVNALKDELTGIKDKYADQVQELKEYGIINEVSDAQQQSASFNSAQNITYEQADGIWGTLIGHTMLFEQAGEKLTLLNATADAIRYNVQEYKNIAADTRDILAGMAIHVEEIRDGMVGSLVPAINTMRADINKIRIAIENQ